MGKRDRERKERVIRGEEAGYRLNSDKPPAELISQAAAQFLLNVLKIK